MDLTDPQQWNGYAYSKNNPATFSDPTGLIPDDCREFECDYVVGCEECNKEKKKENPCWPAKNCQATPKNSKDRGGETVGFTGIVLPPRGQVTLEIFVEAFYGTHITNVDARKLHTARWDLICYNWPEHCENMTEQMQQDVDNFLLDLVGYTDAKNCASGSASGCVMTAVGLIPFGKLKVLGPIGEGIWKGARGACSFSGETKVLMADGTMKAIKDIEVGDEVLATDPETGEQGPRRVTHLWVHEDQLLALRLANGHSITTTEDHPFWNKTDRRWQQAQQLDPGDMLHTSNGTHTSVAGLDWTTASTGTAYNLTIDQIHTYYVLAGQTPVLVHNTGGGSGWCGGQIPSESLDVINSIKKDGVNAQSGAKGPVVPEQFLNDGRNGGTILPRTTAGGDAITYREWGTIPGANNPKPGGERIVTGSDGSIWYTPDHYQTFIRYQ